MSRNQSAIDRRPWGQFEVLAEEPNYKVKRITVNPGQRLSLQKHSRRHEHWVVVSGWGVFSCDGEDKNMREGQATDIPAGATHRVANQGDEPLVFIEVQRGSYLGEDDIVRLEDDYGRLSHPPETS